MGKLSITIDRSLTLGKLVELHHAGYSVFKTPHVGNVHHNNMVCAQLGFKIVLCDTLSGASDKRFRPNGIMRRGQFEQLAPEDKIATHLTVGGESLANRHVAAMKQVCSPSAQIMTDGEYLRQHQPFVEAVCEASLVTHAKLWRRYVGTDGVAQVIQRRVMPEEVRGNLFRVHHTDHGWLIPLQVRILLDAVCEAALTGRDTVYSLSGSDMHQYIQEPQHAPVISGMFERLGDIGVALPPHITLVIVPVQEAQFACAERERPAMDRLVAAYREMRAAAAACTTAFYDSVTAAGALTQHDLLAGDQLYLHPELTSLPMAEFEALAALLHTRGS